MKNNKLLALCVLLSGCSTVRYGTALEATWQASNAIDFSQTVTVARRPTEYQESDRLTSALIGHHPSEQSVEAYWAGYSLFHLAVSSWLMRMADATGKSGWRDAFYTWEALTLSASIYNVQGNFSAGVPLFGSRDHCAPPKGDVVFVQLKPCP